MIKRVTYLDGLRGFAALQVLLLHYIGVFWPAASRAGFFASHPVQFGWCKTFVSLFTAGGGLSVSLFFLISGTVLTYSFEAGNRSFATQTARRAVRLGVPAIGSIILGIICFGILPKAHIQAAIVMGGNPGMAANGPNHFNIPDIANEIFMGSFLLGHDGATLLPHRAKQALGLLDLSHSFNTPLWTLHLEFYGSLLVLLLVTLRKRLTSGWHLSICAALVAVLLANPIAMFVIGYAAARTLRTETWARQTQQPWFKGLAVISLCLGFGALAQVAPGWMIHAFTVYRDMIGLPMQVDLLHGFGQYGALLVFFGIIALRLPQILLESSVAQFLGRYSFSIYLVHFPILYTLGAGLFILLHPYGLGMAITIAPAITLIVTAGAIFFFERLVDQPAITWSRRISMRPLFKRRAVTPAAG